MSISINHLTIAGNLTRDPVIRILAGDRTVAAFGIAHNRRYKVGDEQREETVFLDCEAWGQTAEILGKHFLKGKPILLEGRIKMDRWDDKETGKPRTKLALVVERLHFVPDGTKRSEGQSGPAAASEPPAAGQAPAPAAAAPLGDGEEPPF